MNHLIFGLMQISSPGYHLTWIFPSGKNCHAVVIPGFKCDSAELVQASVSPPENERTKLRDNNRFVYDI